MAEEDLKGAFLHYNNNGKSIMLNNNKKKVTIFNTRDNILHCNFCPLMDN